MKIKFLIEWLLFLLINLSYTTMSVDNIKIERILNTGKANLCIAQDKDGLLWIATEGGGLLSYDGYELKKLKVGKDTSLFEVVLFVFVDSDGIIWCFIQGQGLFSYSKNTGAWKNYNSETTNSSSMTSNNACWGSGIITEDMEGLIWVGTVDGLNSLDKKTGKITQYKHIIDNTNSLSNNTIRTVFVDKEGLIWVGTEDGLNSYDRKNNIFSCYKCNLGGNINGLSDSYIYAINEDKNGNLWIGTKNGGISSFNKQTKKFTAYRNDSNNPSSLSCNEIYHIMVDHSNNLWICNEGGTGIDKYDVRANTFTNYRYSLKNPNSISSNEILYSFEDNSNIIWLIDSTGGVNKCTRKANVLKTYFYNPECSTDLISDNLAKLHEDKRKNIWIGTLKGGLGLYASNDKFEKFDHIDNALFSLPSHTVYSIADAPDDRLWLGCFGGIISLFDPETKQVIKNFRNPYPVNSPANLVIDNKNSELLWFASYFTDRLFKLNTITGEFSQYKHDPHDKRSVSNKNTFNILQDGDILWLGTGGDGLVKFNKTTGKCVYYKHNPNDKNSISGNIVIESFLDSKDNFWVTTDDGGLNKFNRQTGKFTSYGIEHGFSSNSTRHILEDNDGNLWISTDSGIVKFDTKLLKVVKRFTEDEKTQSNEFDKIANSLKDSSGTFWFPKTKGLCKFNPEEANKLEPNRHMPPIVLTSFKSKEGTYNEDGLKKLTEVKLPWLENSFEFTFAALDYVNPEKNRYGYKLEGFDKYWNYIGTNRSGKYTNIPPGKYTLCLKGSNNDGVWNEKGISINITITPPFWMRWWFRVLVVIILLGIIVGIFQLRTKALKERAIHMRDHAIAETTTQVVHDVRKPFSTLKAVLQILPKLTIDQTVKFSKDVDITIRKVEAMLADIMEASRDASYQVTPENILSVLDLAIKDVASRYPDKKVEFYYQLETIPLINLDEHRMCRAFDNIISNAFDFLPNQEGFMWFSVQQEGKVARIIIGNSHSTIPEDKIKDIFQNKFTSGKKSGTGLGLSIVKKVIDGHKGFIAARNVKNMAEFIPDKLKHNSGVEFEITLSLTEKPGYKPKDPLIKNSEEAKSTFGMIQKSNQFAGSFSIDTLIDNLKTLTRKPNLLILDDESIYRTRVRDVLENLGEVNNLIHSYDASTYKEAIDLLNHVKIDFLICDINLSDKQNTGFSVLSYALEKYPECKVLMHTNRKEPSDIDEAKRMGAYGFCPKPITEAVLVDLLLNNNLWPENSKYAKTVPNSKILLVDDEQANLEYKETFIRVYTDPKDSIQLYTAKTGKEAADIIDSINPDILITDFNLNSNMTGTDICQYMRKKNTASICIVFSNMHKNELNKIKNENKNCIDEVFSTPHNIKEILNTVFEIKKKHIKNVG